MAAICFGLYVRKSHGGEKLNSQEFDFGRAPLGKVVNHVFTVTNPYSHPLHIKDVKSSCTCTVLKDVPEIIPAGSSCEFPMKVDLTTDSDRFGSNVTIFFAEHEPITLSVQGNVIRQHPKLVSFGRVMKGAPAEKELVIRSLNDNPMEVVNLRYDKTWLDIKWERSESNKNNVLVQVKLVEDSRYGHFSDVLHVTTNDEDVPLKSIKLEGYVIRPIEATPKTLKFGLLEPGDEERQSLNIVAPYVDPVKLESIEVSDSAISCSLPERSQSNEGFELPVVLRGDFEDKVFKGTLKIYATVAGVPRKLIIDVYGMRRAP